MLTFFILSQGLSVLYALLSVREELTRDRILVAVAFCLTLGLCSLKYENRVSALLTFNVCLAICLLVPQIISAVKQYRANNEAVHNRLIRKVVLATSVVLVVVNNSIYFTLNP